MRACLPMSRAMRGVCTLCNKGNSPSSRGSCRCRFYVWQFIIMCVEAHFVTFFHSDTVRSARFFGFRFCDAALFINMISTGGETSVFRCTELFFMFTWGNNVCVQFHFYYAFNIEKGDNYKLPSHSDEAIYGFHYDDIKFVDIIPWMSRQMCVYILLLFACVGIRMFHL